MLHACLVNPCRAPTPVNEPQAQPAVPDLSIVVPAYDEEDNVGPLYGEIVDAVAPLGQPFEIVFVDDGSRDATFARLAALAARDPGCGWSSSPATTARPRLWPPASTTPAAACW
jgi:cellulose synthase/poly-beta-1,6-N-acetylglucosamine synthase-like glycosyltransferase